MCSSIGVDPLVGGSTSGRRGKGWNLLGVGEFWIRVAIRVVRICRATRDENGGFISVSEVKRILVSEDKQTRQLSKTNIMEISEYSLKVVKSVDYRDDIVRSISSLAPLGPGLSVVTLASGERYIRSIPKELNPDQATVLQVAGIIGFISVGMLKINLGWEDERSKSVLEELVVEGMVWVDDAGDEREYWIPRGITEL
jgi:ESCRT-II complex subunit VPS22